MLVLASHFVLGLGMGPLSFVSCTAAVVFSVAAFRAAENKALKASDMLQGLYLTTMPGTASVSPFIAEMWLEALPSQARSWIASNTLNIHSSFFTASMKTLSTSSARILLKWMQTWLSCPRKQNKPTK